MQVHEDVGAHETIEPVAALIRQSASRAMERLRLQFTRNQSAAQHSTAMMGGPPPPVPSLLSQGGDTTLTAASMRKPIDIFVIQFCLYYLDCSRLPAKHYVRLAQEVVTGAVERVLVPSLFQRVQSLPMLCESLVLERSSEEVQDCLKEMEEFVEAREALGAWLAGLGDLAQPDDDGEEEDWAPYDYGADRKRHAGEGPDGWPKKEEEEHVPREGEDDEIATRAGGVGRRRDGHGEVAVSGVDVAGWLYESLEFWLRIRGFLHAWSFSTANLHAFPLRARYERELMQLLGSLSDTRKRVAASTGEGSGAQGANASSTMSASTLALTEKTNASLSVPTSLPKSEPSSLVKQEKLDWYDADGLDVAEQIYHGREDSDDEQNENTSTGVTQATSHAQRDRHAELAHHHRNVATTVLADVLALSECPAPPPLTGQAQNPPSPSTATPAAASSSSSLILTDAVRHVLRGVNPTFFTMVHARLSVMVARDHLTGFSRTAGLVAAPPLTTLQENVRQQQETLRQQYLAYYGTLGAAAAAGDGGDVNAAASGLPLDYVPDDQYYLKLMQKVAPEEAELGDDEELFKDEVVDYYKHKTGGLGGATTTPSTSTNEENRPQPEEQQVPPQHGRGRGPPKDAPAQKELIKPERFCRMGTGYRWTQYNRTHYDSHTNPPPRTVMWYKFTLLFPLLADTKRDMRTIFRIEDTPRGPADDHCILVFSPGPPYADVAYRIVKQQWDTRRGGVNVSFDSTGRFQLFFRFSNSNYRR